MNSFAHHTSIQQLRLRKSSKALLTYLVNTNQNLFKKSQLADSLRLSRPTLDQALTELRSEGHIRFVSTSIQIQIKVTTTIDLNSPINVLGNIQTLDLQPAQMLLLQEALEVNSATPHLSWKILSMREKHEDLATRYGVSIRTMKRMVKDLSVKNHILIERKFVRDVNGTNNQVANGYITNVRTVFAHQFKRSFYSLHRNSQTESTTTGIDRIDAYIMQEAIWWKRFGINRNEYYKVRSFNNFYNHNERKDRRIAEHNEVIELVRNREQSMGITYEELYAA